MAQENVAGTWFRYFPEHYLWSQLMSSTISLTSMGGTNFQELNLIGRRLQGKVGDGEAWHDAWAWMADKTLAHADREWDKGHRRTAAGRLRAQRHLPLRDRALRAADRSAQDRVLRNAAAALSQGHELSRAGFREGGRAFRERQPAGLLDSAAQPHRQ